MSPCGLPVCVSPSLFLLCAPLFAQPRALTAADYARAEKFMAYNTTPLVYRATVRPNWLADDRFWYRVTTPAGSEFVLVDPAKGTRAPAFDHAKLAIALTAAANSKYEAGSLPFTEIDLTADGQYVSFNAAGKRWKCDTKGAACASEGAALPSTGGDAEDGAAAAARFRVDAPSPDGQRVAFIRDWNLWVRDVASRKETQLTRDGVKDFGYATDNAGWTSSDRPIVKWSPDSKKIATYQQDQRGVGEMYLVDTRVGHPNLRAWKYPLPGDETVTMIQRVVIDVDSAAVVRFQMPPDQHRSSLCDDLACRGDWEDVQWSPDARARRVRLHVARPQARAASHRGRRHRRGARCPRGERPDVLRIRQQPRELALFAEIERDPVVFRAGQLGPPVPLRCDHRKAEASRHLRRGQCHAGSPRRRRRARASTFLESGGRRAATRISRTCTGSAWTAGTSRC